jgi:hypothetical protein
MGAGRHTAPALGQARFVPERHSMVKSFKGNVLRSRIPRPACAPTVSMRRDVVSR